MANKPSSGQHGSINAVNLARAVRTYAAMMPKMVQGAAAAIDPTFANRFPDRKTRATLRKFAQTWTAFSLYGDTPGTASDEMKTLTAVLDKWCTRGIPTRLDSSALEAYPKVARSVAQDEPLNTVLAAAVRLLLHAPNTDSYRQLTHHIEGVASEEEHLFYEACRRQLPAAAFARLMPQATFDALGCTLGKAHDRRVDFALLLKSDWKWVIEIDGTQHADPVQARDDHQREIALDKEGWRVHRVAASEVRNDADGCVTKWLAAINEPQRRVLASLSEEPDWACRWESAAFTQIVFPCAVQRCLRAWIHALRQGTLTPDAPWHIKLAGPEWEAPYVALGVLRRWWTLVCDLGLVDTPPPEVLKVSIDRAPDGAHASVIGLPTPVVDAEAAACLCLDFSAALPPGMHADSAEEVTCPRLFVRCAYTSKPERALKETRRKFYPTVDELVAKRGTEAAEAHRRAATVALRMFFGYDNFRDGQYVSVSRLISGQDTVTLLPTGGGKSAIIHLSGLLLPGASLLIEPLVSLLADQVENLRAVLCDANGYIDSSLTGEEKAQMMALFESGGLHMLTISPERLQIEEFRHAVRRAGQSFSLGLAAIDEAHCVSEWGHDFRPSYLHLIHNLRHFASSLGSPPVISALTGTASFAVLSDIQAELGVVDDRSLVTPTSFGRKEIRYEVIDTRGDWRGELKALKRRLPKEFGLQSETQLHDPSNKVAGIIFCATVKGKGPSVESVSSLLGHDHIYCGSTPTGFDEKTWGAYKSDLLLKFKDDALTEIIASKSIGMGFDKPNVRYCIHTSLPESIESFYQESGRAGRDGRVGARSFVLVESRSIQSAEVWSHTDPEKKIAALARSSGEWGTRGFFLQQGFPGAKKEIEQMIAFLTPMLTTKGVCVIPDGKDTEKWLYRGIMLGVIEDYTKDYRGRSFKVTFPQNVTASSIIDSLRNYLRRCKFEDYTNERFEGINDRVPTLKALEACIRIYVNYVYEEVLNRRLQSLMTMSDLCLYFKNHDSFNDDMLAYLSESKYTKILKKWAGKSLREIPAAELISLCAGCESMQDRNLLLGTARRTLDNDPNNAAVLWIVMMGTLTLYPDRPQETELKRLLKLTHSAIGSKGLPIELAVELWRVASASTLNARLLEQMSQAWLTHPDADEFARSLLREHPESPLGHQVALNHLLANASAQLREILSKL